MAGWVFCNRCFRPPSQAARFSLTSCGHVYCAGCLSRGKKDECLICKVPCHTVLLSKHWLLRLLVPGHRVCVFMCVPVHETDPGIQALFMDIDSLCKTYSRETSQISEFQEKHRKRLLAFYREKISRLEEALRKSALRVEQLQSMRLSQHTAFSTMNNTVSTPPAAPSGQLLPPPGPSASERVEPMEVDLTPSPTRRPELAAGPTRISLISPPRDGRMGVPPAAALSLARPAGVPPAAALSLARPAGVPPAAALSLARPAGVPPAAALSLARPAGSVSSLGPQQFRPTPGHTSLSQAPRISPLQMPRQGSFHSLGPQAAGGAGGGGSPAPARPPISISGLLQRQQLGSASLGGFSVRR